MFFACSSFSLNLFQNVHCDTFFAVRVSPVRLLEIISKFLYFIFIFYYFYVFAIPRKASVQESFRKLTFAGLVEGRQTIFCGRSLYSAHKTE